MRHRVSGRKFDRPGDERAALLKGLVGDLLRHERLKTTEAKAKEVRPIAERMITLGKDGTVHARRQAAAYIADKTVVKKLFDDIAPRFAARPGGYTRIIKLGPRHGDGAQMAQLELVERGV
jgi:large subunit ribosomal protein L17